MARAYSLLRASLTATSAVASTCCNTANSFGYQSASAICSTSSAVSRRAHEIWLQAAAATRAFALAYGRWSYVNIKSLGAATLAGCSYGAHSLASASVTFINAVSPIARLSAAATYSAGRRMAALTYATLVRLHRVSTAGLARLARVCRHTIPPLAGWAFFTALVAIEWVVTCLCEVCLCCV